MKSRTVATYIAAPAAAIYEFASNPLNLPAWAPSFCRSVQAVDGRWVVDSPLGKVVFRFAAANPFGVLDHSVELPSGVTLSNPMRVIANGDGSEALFTLFQSDGMSDAQFDKDETQVRADLQMLRQIMENSSLLAQM